MNEHDKAELTFLKKLMGHLEGGTVIFAGGAQDEDGDIFPAVVIEKDGKTYQVLFLMDPEGNGAGFPEIIQA